MQKRDGLQSWAEFNASVFWHLGFGAWNATVQTLHNGVPTWQGWLEFSKSHGLMGVAGVIGALTFWLILRLCGAVKTT